MAFLEQTAQQIWLQHDTDVSNHLFLFPSRRSMLYFKRAITDVAGQNLWMPDCLTLEDWILDQSDYLPVDPITSAYELYLSARHIIFTTNEFEVFYPLAKIILSDFEQVDKAMVDADKIWRHTAAWQNLNDEEKPPMVWDEMKDSPLKERWVVNWNKLQRLYDHFTQQLRSKSLATKGRIYKDIAENMENVAPLLYPQIHVIGFSSLSQSEVKILEFFQSEYSISFYWFLPLQISAPGLDAGENVLHWSNHFGQDLDIVPTNFPEVEVISTSGMIPQMKEVSQLLSKADGDEDSMAVLLPHPSLIDLFLRSFPDNRSAVNVSLGYPLIYSPSRPLLQWILLVWEEMEQNNGRIKRPDLERIWSHSYMANYMKVKHIKKSDSRQLYFRQADLTTEDILISALYTPLVTPSQALGRLIVIVEELIPVQSDVFHREVLRYVMGRLVRMSDVLSKVKDISIVFIKRILVEMMQTASVPFRGEPMKGVQVLGVQEVQNLAFDTLIIPGMNEEILPAGKIKSMIPFSLRSHYGLEDQGDLHAAQSYYIWSAILQAHKVYLLYSQGDDFLGAKGMSRYIYQLKYGGLNIPVKERYLDLELEGFESGMKTIWMTEEYRHRLRKYLQEDGLSPTALMSYIRCPFQFFLRYVLRIDEDDVPRAGLDYRDMGTVIHDVMNDLYAPWQGSVISKKDMDDIKNKIESLTAARYRGLYPNDSEESLNQGLHWVEQQIIIRAVRQIVDYDAKLNGLKIELLEANLTKKISTSTIKDVLLRGKVDRLDRVKNVSRIIDYKTGFSDLKAKNIFSLWEDKSPAHNWQLLFYAYLIKDQLGVLPFELGHYTLKEKRLYVPMKTNRIKEHSINDLNEFEAVLKDIIDEMADPEKPFCQTDNITHCKYCVFNTFCERQGGN